MVVTRLRSALALAVALPFLLAACDGGSPPPPAPAFDASVLESDSVQIGGASLREKRGLFGPDLNFVVRLPAQWDGRLLVAFPGSAADAAAGPAASAPAGAFNLDAFNLDAFADERVRAGTAYASLETPDGADVASVSLAFVAFARDQVVAEYGRQAERTYLVGVSLGGGGVQRMIEGDEPLVDGALLVSPWGRADVLRDYPTLLRTVALLEPAFPQLKAGSLARVRADELALVQALFADGLPVGSEPSWPAQVAVWSDALQASLAMLDPSYAAANAALDQYDLGARPAAVQAAVHQALPPGRLTARTIVLQGGWDLLALPSWSQRYAERAAEEDRALGLVRYVFPQANHALLADGEAGNFRQARLQRAWEVLLGWVEDRVSPGSILGLAPDGAA